MEQDAKDQISDDTILDEAHDCQDCANAGLIDRQRKEIERLAAANLTLSKKAFDAETRRKEAEDRCIQLLQDSISAGKTIAALKEELEAERGRNRVLGFQIRTLREGKK